MLWFKIVVFLLIMTALPCGVGLLFFRGIAGRPGGLAYLGGLAACFALFELLAIPFTLLGGSFRLLAALYGLAVAAMAAAGYWLSRGTLSFRPTRPDCQKLILLLMIVAVVAVQALRSSAKATYINTDDACYVGTAATTLYTDRMGWFDHYTGFPSNPFIELERSMAPWSTFWAMFSLLLRVAPTTFTFKFLPLLLIPLAYYAAYLVAKKLFGGSSLHALGVVLFLCIFYYFTSFDQGLAQWWLMNVSWYGKSVVPHIMAPLVIYLLQCLETDDPVLRKRLWLALFTASVASCLVGATAFVLIPAVLGCWGLVYLWRTRDLTAFWKLPVCMLPCVALLTVSYL